MIRVYYGSDTFRSREAFRDACKRVAGSSRAACTILRDEDLTPAALAAAVGGQTLFGEVPPVVAERLTKFSGREAQAITEALRAVPKSQELLVWEDGVPPAQGIVWRALQEVADHAEAFDSLTEEETHAWIKKRVSAYDRSLTSEAITRLLEACGSDLWLLSTSLEVITLGCSTDPIPAAEVATFIPSSPSGEVFPIVHALVGGDAAEALRRLTMLKQRGDDARMVLFWFLRDLQHLLRIRRALDERQPVTAWSIARDARLPRAAAEHLLRAARAATADSLRVLFDRCVVSYYHLNTGRAEAEEILESLCWPKVSALQS